MTVRAGFVRAVSRAAAPEWAARALARMLDCGIRCVGPRKAVGLLNLAQQPAAKSLRVQWATARVVSNTSGGSLTTTSAMKNTDVTYTVKRIPEYSDTPDASVVPPTLGYKPDVYKPLLSNT